jgi:hypothetical protein
MENKIKIIQTIIPIGNSQGIIIDKTIMRLFSLKVGDEINISDMFKVIHPRPLPSNQTKKEIKNHVQSK